MKVFKVWESHFEVRRDMVALLALYLHLIKELIDRHIEVVDLALKRDDHVGDVFAY